MERYIDLEELVKRINKNIKPEIPEEKAFLEWCKDECIRQGYAMPAADVVPKSEVVNALNEVELLIIITKEMYKQQMEDAPNELSKQSKRTKWVAFEKFYEQFSELKKKYTGEKE